MRLFDINAQEEDLEDLRGMQVINISNYKNELEHEGVIIEFEGEYGEKVALDISIDAPLQRTKAQFPLYTAQDLREYEGFTIKEVQSDDMDCNCRVILEDKGGKTVTLLADDALNGETLFIEKDEEI